ncbi:MAG: hypothetical protein IT256_02435 [Chitinophagaceae bacterium]|nr:hypothetical protein [Chitinophagaceae bacterium]
MDIAKYIGLYILKNKYCCLQGLGNLEIKKIPAQHHGDQLTSPSYVAQLDPQGSIDDSFPNFVANNERVSIAKASNEISDFIRNSKVKLANGEAIIVPSVGQYILQGHRLSFELDANFSLPTSPIHFPIATTAAPTPETPKPDGHLFESFNNTNKQSAINWNMVAIWGIIIVIGASIIGWGVRYFINQTPSPEIVEQAPSPIQVPIAVAEDTTANSIDSAALAAISPTSSTDTGSYTFLIKEYNTLAKAEKRQKQLISFGYNVGLKTIDSNLHYVISTIRATPADTAHIRDSLSRNLNPSGVRILP